MIPRSPSPGHESTATTSPGPRRFPPRPTRCRWRAPDVFHALLVDWFHFVRDHGMVGIFVLMAIESTVFPLPSEVVVPPAAYWAATRPQFWGVILAAALGSWAGAAVSYVVARVVGRPLILRYGRFVLITEKKW